MRTAILASTISVTYYVSTYSLKLLFVLICLFRLHINGYSLNFSEDRMKIEWDWEIAYVFHNTVPINDTGESNNNLLKTKRSYYIMYDTVNKPRVV